MHTRNARRWAIAFTGALTTFSAIPALADAVTFNFTAQITDSVLYNGVYQPVWNPYVPAGWLGQTISGSIRLDLGPQEPTVYLADQISILAKSEKYYPSTSWMTLNINQPDGSILSIPSGPQPHPIPTEEGDDAYTSLWNDAGSNGALQDMFYAQRTWTNGETYPQQSFSVSLSATGPGNLSLVDSIDYRRARFDATQANWTNSGLVSNFSSQTDGYSYGFSVLSLTSTVSAVPEPASTALMGLGLAALLWLGRRRRGDETGLTMA